MDDQKPQFPIIMFLVAAVKDVGIDLTILAVSVSAISIQVIPIIGQIVGVPLFGFAWVLGIMASITFSIVFYIWAFFKADARKSKATFKLARNITLATFVGFVPFIRFLIPEFMTIVWLTYRSEKKEYEKKKQKTLGNQPQLV